MLVAQHRWYHAEIIGDMSKKLCRSVYVKKSEDNEGKPMVRVWDGRWYRELWTVEDARQHIKLGSVVEDQERLENDYSWYLNY